MGQSNIKNFNSVFTSLANTHLNHSALKFGEKELTYSELKKEVDRVAAILISKSLKQYDFVGINLPRSIETIVSILAVLKIGASYIPLDPTYPADRINFIIKDAGIKAILSRSDVKKQNLAATTINLDETETNELNNDNVNINPNDTAYVIYTSGSTGKPKGVEITHENLINFTRLAQSTLETNSDDVCLGTASINYALSVRQIFVPFTIGAKLVFASDDELKDPEKLLLLIKNEKITQIDLVPSHLRSIVFYLLSLKTELRKELLNNDLKRIITVGEPLSADLVNLWYKQLNQLCPIINIFGQTETTGIISSYKTNPSELLTGTVPIGKPIQETEIFILDENLDPLPEGIEGELCVSNSCIAKNYLNNPELTKNKFFDNKFDKLSDNKIYRTGDLVISRNNLIYYIGRKDNQIKIRGMRVEIGEIEFAINEIDLVEQAVVLPLKSENDIILTAFIKSTTDVKINFDSIKKYLSGKIPIHMVPTNFVQLDGFPLNPNGKIDKLKLSEFKAAETEILSDTNILNETESKLLFLWQKVLRKNTFSVNDDFFSIGGDSLSAVNLFILIEKELKKHLPVSILYQSPTISKLAKTLLFDVKGNQGLKSLVPIKTEGNKFPLFFIHGAGGNILLYKDLVKYLDEDIPFYGLQSVGLDGQNAKLNSIEEMANHYLQEIRIIQPSGPYFLGGYCMGGTVALEIAQILKKQGEKINAVFLLETYNWCALPPRNSFERFYHSFQKIIFHFNNLFILNWQDKKLFLTNKWNELKSRKNIWIAEFMNSISAPQKENHIYSVRLAEIWAENDKAAFQYNSRIYDGEVYQFLPKKRYQIHSNKFANWDSIVPKTKVIILPVYAAGMLVEPFVKILAKEINKILAQKNS